MRQWKTQHRPNTEIKKVTRQSLEFLTRAGQIFYEALPETLDRIEANGVIRWYEKGEIVFEQGVRADNLPFFCVLSGRFDVVHIWGDAHRHVATDSAGALIGDVELLLRGEKLDQEETAIRGLSASQTWGKVVCAAPGELLSIWPADFLLEGDHAVAVALARSLARKLLLRSAVADPKTILPKTRQVELYLRRLARDMAGAEGNLGGSIELPLSLADIAEEVECAKQTVAIALKELADQYEGFSHRRNLIIVPKSFLKSPDLADLSLP